jgi:hypothetical protein
VKQKIIRINKFHALLKKVILYPGRTVSAFSFERLRHFAGISDVASSEEPENYKLPGAFES